MWQAGPPIQEISSCTCYHYLSIWSTCHMPFPKDTWWLHLKWNFQRTAWKLHPSILLSLNHFPVTFLYFFWWWFGARSCPELKFITVWPKSRKGQPGLTQFWHEFERFLPKALFRSQIIWIYTAQVCSKSISSLPTIVNFPVILLYIFLQNEWGTKKWWKAGDDCEFQKKIERPLGVLGRGYSLQSMVLWQLSFHAITEMYSSVSILFCSGDLQDSCYG